MTPDELAEIRAREQAATPGPWTWTAGMIEAPPDADGGMEAVLWTANIPGEYDDDDYRAALGACGNHAEEHAADNLAFIAHARKDVPALLAHIAELEAELTAMHDEAGHATARIRELEADRTSMTAEKERFRRTIELAGGMCTCFSVVAAESLVRNEQDDDDDAH